MSPRPDIFIETVLPPAVNCSNLHQNWQVLKSDAKKIPARALWAKTQNQNHNYLHRPYGSVEPSSFKIKEDHSGTSSLPALLMILLAPSMTWHVSTKMARSQILMAIRAKANLNLLFTQICLADDTACPRADLTCLRQIDLWRRIAVSSTTVLLDASWHQDNLFLVWKTQINMQYDEHSFEAQRSIANITQVEQLHIRDCQ